MDDDTGMPVIGVSVPGIDDFSMFPWPVPGRARARRNGRNDSRSRTSDAVSDARPSPGWCSHIYDDLPSQLPTLAPYRRLPLPRAPTWEEVPNNMKLILMRELTTWYSYRTSVAALRLTHRDECAFVELYNAEIQKKMSLDYNMRSYASANTAALDMTRRVTAPSYETDTIAMQDFDLAWSFLEGIGLDSRTFDLAHWTAHVGVDRFRFVPAERDPSVAVRHQCQLTDSSSVQRPRPSRRTPALCQSTFARQQRLSGRQDQPLSRSTRARGVHRPDLNSNNNSPSSASLLTPAKPVTRASTSKSTSARYEYSDYCPPEFRTSLYVPLKAKEFQKRSTI